MKAIVSAIFGTLSFVIISGTQLNLVLHRRLSGDTELIPEIYSISPFTKTFVLIMAFLAIWSSVYYDKSGETKLKIINKVGRLLGILAVLLSFIPIYSMINFAN